MSRSSATSPGPALTSFLFLLALALLGGLTALGHQVLWTRRMVDILGGTAESTSRVLGCFFLGLALGAAAAARYAPRLARPWRALALIEGGIILTALPFLFLPPVLDTFWLWAGPDFLHGRAGMVTKTVASLIAVVPPAFFMGCFLPLAARGLFADAKAFREKGLWLYGGNTLGGVAGIALLSLWSLHRWGVTGSFFLLLFLHLLILSGLIVLDRRLPARPRTIEPAPPPFTASQTSQAGWLLALSFFSGFSILAFEVISLESLMLVAPLSFHAPAAILFGVILLLGLAALLAIPLREKAALLPVFLLFGGLATALSPLAFYFLSQLLEGLPPQPTFAAFWWRLLALSLLSFGPALFLAGFVFPLLSIAWSRTSSGSVASSADPARWGWLLSVNGAGGFIGAETAYRLLLPGAGLYPALGILGALSSLLALLLWLKSPWQTARNLPIALSGSVVLVIVWGTFTLLPQIPTINPHLGWQTVWEQSGPEGTVSVVEGPGIERGILISNQYLLGSIGARWEQERQGHLPLLLHPRPERVAFLGVATGMTPAAAVHQQAPREIIAWEISRSVLRVAETFFAEENEPLFSDHRVRLIREDARLGVLAQEKAFDLIIGDLFLPWGPGEARLYSREHFAATRRALREGGLFAQWLPLYQLTEEHLASIVQTAREVFPEMHFFLGGLSLHQPMLLMVAGDGPLFTPEIIRQRINEEKAVLRDPFLRHEQALALLDLGQSLGLPPAPVNTLDNLYLEQRASRDRIVVQPHQPYLEGADLVHWLESSPRPEIFTRVSLPIFQWATRSRPDAPLPRALRENLPGELREDAEADWSRWTGPRP